MSGVAYTASCGESGLEDTRNPEDPIENARLIGNLTPGTQYSCVVYGVGDGKNYARRRGLSATIRVSTLPLDTPTPVTPSPTPTPIPCANCPTPTPILHTLTELTIVNNNGEIAMIDGSIYLTWGSVNGGTYSVFYRKEGHSSWTAVNAEDIYTSSARALVKDLVSATGYEFKVEARTGSSLHTSSITQTLPDPIPSLGYQSDNTIKYELGKL